MNIVVRNVIVGFVVVTFGLIGNPIDSTQSLVAQEVELRFEEYEQKLNAILLTRRDEERDFVKQVVEKVEAGAIPERLVETSYKWVMNKRPNTKYPFVYFERVLRLQAEKVEIADEVPEFDYEIYNRRARRRR